MSEVTRDIAVVTIGGRVAIDLGIHNQEEAYRLEQRLNGPGVVITVDGEPA